MRLNYLTSWMGDHARHSILYQQLLLKQREKVPKDFFVYIISGSDKAKVIMADGYGIARILGIDSKKVIYVKSAYQLPFSIENNEPWMEENKIAVFHL